MRRRLLQAFSFNDYPCPQAAIHPVTSSALGALSGPCASYPQPDRHPVLANLLHISHPTLSLLRAAAPRIPPPEMISPSRYFPVQVSALCLQCYSP